MRHGADDITEGKARDGERPGHFLGDRDTDRYFRVAPFEVCQAFVEALIQVCVNLLGRV